MKNEVTVYTQICNFRSNKDFTSNAAALMIQAHDFYKLKSTLSQSNTVFFPTLLGQNQ